MRFQNTRRLISDYLKTSHNHLSVFDYITDLLVSPVTSLVLTVQLPTPKHSRNLTNRGCNSSQHSKELEELFVHRTTRDCKEIGKQRGARKNSIKRRKNYETFDKIQISFNFPALKRYRVAFETSLTFFFGVSALEEIRFIRISLIF